MYSKTKNVLYCALVGVFLIGGFNTLTTTASSLKANQVSQIEARLAMAE